MQFNDTVNKQGITQDADFFAGSTTDSYPLADKARRANQWVAKAGTWIWKSSHDWQFDDSNETTLPVCFTTMVADQTEYALPTNVFSVDRAEVLDNNGVWHRLKAIDPKQFSRSFKEQIDQISGLPNQYDLVGTQLRILPAASADQTTLVDGLRLYITRTTTTFSANDTNTEVGFNSMFHQIVSTGMAFDYAVKTMNTEKQVALKRVIYGDPNVKGDDGLKGELEEFYAQRHTRDFKTRVVPKYRTSI